MRPLKTGGDGSKLGQLKCFKGSRLDSPLQLTHNFAFPMPDSSLCEDLGFLVAKSSPGDDPGVQWAGHHAWLDKLYKIPDLYSLSF